ncbi:DUF4397 domain-containing protein [Halalkalicoccus tibetensis]|uniref:DUF4397 domain-containing protein n=1 Tax=Halalkalicoccus tibetensis TaxID=175632 RepID=A0ABD5V283_9EURY
MIDHTRRSVLAAAGTGIALAAGSSVAGADEHGDDPETGDDGARVVHLSPDAPALDIYVEGELWFETVESLTVQDHYMPSEPGVYEVAAVPAGGELEDALVETDCEVEPGPCTLGVVGEVCNLSGNPLDLVALKDDFEPTEEDHARFRVVHAAPDVPAVDVETEDGMVIAEGLGFGEAATAELPAGESIVSIGADGESLARFALEPAAGSVYSAFAVGYRDPEGAPDDAPEEFSFSLALSEDATPGER